MDRSDKTSYREISSGTDSDESGKWQLSTVSQEKKGLQVSKQEK